MGRRVFRKGVEREGGWVVIVSSVVVVLVIFGSLLEIFLVFIFVLSNSNVFFNKIFRRFVRIFMCEVYRV